MFMALFALVALAVALIVRRREAFRLRWAPTRHTWAAVAGGLLAFALSALILGVSPGSVPGLLLLYGGIYVVCGIVVPWGYVLLIERGTLADLGVTAHRWKLALLISVIMAALFSPVLVFEADWAAVDWGDLGRAGFVLLWGGLFETFLYYGLIHRRLEAAFGVIPAILVTAVLYVMWHVGTQLPLEADPVAAAWKLLFVGIMYQSVFSLTRNVLSIWPLFFEMGVMIDFVVNVGAVGPIAARFPWGLGAAVAMIACMALIWRQRRREPRAPAHPARRDAGVAEG